MIFASIVRAESNWKVVLVRRDGSPSIVNIDSWGKCNLSGNADAPLDNIGQDLSKRENFVMVLNPNYPMTKQQIAATAMRRARELKWVA